MTDAFEGLIRLTDSSLAHAGKGDSRPAVRVIRDARELEQIQAGWDSVAFELGSPMLNCDWARSCADVFGLGTRLEILVCGSPGTAAIAPLFRSGRISGRRELLGASELGEPMNFLYSEPSAVEPLAKALAEARYSVLLRRLPADSPIIEALKRAYRGRGFVACRPSDGFLRLALDQSWIEPETHLNSGRRSDLRRLRKIAAKFGEITIEIAKPQPDELTPLLDEAYEVEASGWKGAEGSALARDARRGPFLRRYAAAACERGLLRLCFLRLGAQAAAVQIAIEVAHGFWLLKIGYRDEFARCSPGTLLMRETIAYAAKSGLRSYEFLGRDEAWLHMWSPLSCPCVSIAAYPFDTRGALALGQDALTVFRQKLSGIRKWR
jgi:CelD/BcsL family acetyltransferase involved in cellulose biosynthesis